MDPKTDKKYKGKSRNQRNSDKYKKFVGSNATGQGFADTRKRKAQYEFMKVLKKIKKQGGQPAHTDFDPEKLQKSTRKNSKKKEKKNMNRFSKAVAEANQRKADKKRKREEAEKRRQEIEEARKKSMAERREKYLKLSKRTHKGQPIMRYRIEHLLGEVEKFRGQRKPEES